MRMLQTHRMLAGVLEKQELSPGSKADGLSRSWLLGMCKWQLRPPGPSAIVPSGIVEDCGLVSVLDKLRLQRVPV